MNPAILPALLQRPGRVAAAHICARHTRITIRREKNPPETCGSAGADAEGFIVVLEPPGPNKRLGKCQTPAGTASRRSHLTWGNCAVPGRNAR